MTAEPVDAYPAEVVARAREVGDAIQAAVAARIMAEPEYAASMYAVGFDALSSSLRQGPSVLLDNGPLLGLVVDVYNYVATGEATDDLIARIQATFASAEPIGA